MSLEDRIRDAAVYRCGHSGPRLLTLARFIAEKWPALKVNCRPSRYSTDTKAGRLRVPKKGRKGTLLEVHEKIDGEWVRILRHHSGETYRHNSEVCAWIVGRLRADG